MSESRVLLRILAREKENALQLHQKKAGSVILIPSNTLKHFISSPYISCAEPMPVVSKEPYPVKGISCFYLLQGQIF